uniref:Uncharacterized protein n=1 Tax=Spironucleus salmonicida TaxID=348837 RepID=V6LL25_9EUKA|eukprot:EST45252.1 Hypothetical protein SS50377_14828 [Spironucleus salmonicida]
MHSWRPFYLSNLLTGLDDVDLVSLSINIRSSEYIEQVFYIPVECVQPRTALVQAGSHSELALLESFIAIYTGGQFITIRSIADSKAGFSIAVALFCSIPVQEAHFPSLRKQVFCKECRFFSGRIRLSRIIARGVGSYLQQIPREVGQRVLRGPDQLAKLEMQSLQVVEWIQFTLQSEF